MKQLRRIAAVRVVLLTLITTSFGIMPPTAAIRAQGELNIANISVASSITLGQQATMDFDILNPTGQDVTVKVLGRSQANCRASFYRWTSSPLCRITILRCSIC